mgnify:CR=1 FL=1
MTGILNEIKKLSQNDFAAQTFYLASLLTLVLLYVPFSPIAEIDLNKLNMLLPFLTWVGSSFDIVFAILECLFASIPISVLLKVFCDHVHLSEDSVIFDDLSYKAAKLSIIIGLVLPILCRFTTARESVIVFDTIDHFGVFDGIAFFGAFLTFGIFVTLLPGKHLTRKNRILGL